AGFVEPGESLEQALAREVHEEAGIEVCDIEYQLSQPWPFPHSLMMGFTAQWQSGDLHIDPVELETGDWFAINDLPDTPPEGTIAHRLIEIAIGKAQQE
ncbi:NAD(+) diphosphatase, partial [Idiomarina sp.]